MNRRVFALGIGLVGVLLALLSVGMFRDQGASEAAKNRSQIKALETLAESVIGTKAPDFELVALNGDTVRLSDFKGQPLVINFWATWCQPCAQEHPNLQAAAERFQAQGVGFVGMLYDDDVKKAKAYLKWAGAAYPTVVDVGGVVADAYGVTGVPETYFISANGLIVDKVAEPLLRIEEIDKRIVAALKFSEEAEAVAPVTQEVLGPPLGDPILEEAVVLTRAQSLGEGLRCPVCRSQSVAESTSGAARTMMRQIEQLVRQGYSNEQVVDFFVDQHGEGVHLAPPKAGLGLIAWGAPLLACLVGLVVLKMLIRPGESKGAESPDVHEDALTAQLMAELEEGE
jgi:cytochrome c biogenesis protein CcmG/thiol:disulfide interchange protein DsbE